MGKRIADESFIKEALRLVQNGEAQIELDIMNVLGGIDYAEVEVSRSKDGRGAYVGAWIWVHFPEKEE